MKITTKMDPFHEDFSSLRSLLTSSQIRRLFLSTADRQSINCMPGSGPGDNYMSIVKRIKIGLDSDDPETAGNHVSLIVKRQVSGPMRRKLFRFNEIFSNEIHAYNVVVPYLKQFMPIPRDLMFPECFFAGTDSSNEIILIMEDLKEQGFFLFDRQTDMDLEMCKAIVSEIARFHAASLVARIKDYRTYKVLVDDLKDVVYSPSAERLYTKLLKSSLSIAVHSLELSNNDGSLSGPIQMLKRLRGKFFTSMRRCVLRADHIHSVICHGDLWVNNIMVNRSTQPPGVKFVDLQALRYGSPIFDILHVLYTGTRRELRATHTREILHTYCSQLNHYVEITIPESINALRAIKDSYSVRNIGDQYEKSLIYGLGVSLWILPACTFDPNNLPNLDNVSEGPNCEEEILQNIKSKLTDRYHIRMRETVLEFYENGCLAKLIHELERSGELLPEN